MKTVNAIAIILVIIGALNWGLVGLLSIDLVATIFGAMTTLSRIVYTLVGLAGVLVLINSPKLLK